MPERTRFCFRPRMIGPDMYVESWTVDEAIAAFGDNIGLDIAVIERDESRPEGERYITIKIGTGRTFYVLF